jgi:type II restriction/modification system DNA methylase subunit YeeA
MNDKRRRISKYVNMPESNRVVFRYISTHTHTSTTQQYYYIHVYLQYTLINDLDNYNTIQYNSIQYNTIQCGLITFYIHACLSACPFVSVCTVGC